MPMNLKDHWDNLTLSEKLQKEVTRVETIFVECRENFGKGGDFLFGGFSAADMMFAPIATRMDTYGVELCNTARDYVDAILSYGPFETWRAAAILEQHTFPASQLPENVRYLG